MFEWSLLFELNQRNIIVVAVIAWLLWLNHACNTLLPETEPIRYHKHKHHNTKGGFGARSKTSLPRMYMIAGGSGFIGSWIARYLLARGDKVIIMDTDKPPTDVIKHGATWVNVDLTFSFGIKNEINKLRDSVSPDTQFIIYNCSVRKRYELSNFRADVGLSAAENLYIALSNFLQCRVFVIHVGDSLAHRMPIKNVDRFLPTPDMWCQMSAPITTEAEDVASLMSDKEGSQDRAFNSYAWHQLQVENLTLRLPVVNPAVAGTAVLRVDGIPSGHAGDGFLTPMLRQGWTFVHSGNVPLTIVNVEDIARACLSLEYMLLDPRTREQASSHSFVVGSSEVTTLNRIFEYINNKRHKGLWAIPIPPALAFALTGLMSLVYTGRPIAKRGLNDHLLRMSPPFLTFARFYSCQIGHIPNPVNEKHQKEVLCLHNNYTLSATLDNLVEDVDELERLEKEHLATSGKI